MNNRFADKNTQSSSLLLTPMKKSSNIDLIQQKSKGLDLQEQRMKNYVQLQNFYMPFLKKAYQEYKSKTLNLKAPQQLIVQSKQFEYKQNELKRKLQFIQKDNEAKENKMRQIINKNQILQSRLKNYNANQQIQIDNTNGLQDSKIKRFETLIKIKNEEIFFRLKFKSLNLLEDFDIDKNQIDLISKLESQYQIFESTINVLKQKAKSLKIKERQIADLNSNYNLELEKREDRINYLMEVNQMVKLNQRKLKDKVQEIKKQWNINYQRLIIREKQNQEKDNEIFRLTKILQERDTYLLKSTSTLQINAEQIDQQKKQLELQIRELKTTINNYIMQNNQLLETIEQKENQIESNKIKQRYNQQEYQRVNREFIRWKERYEGLEKQKQNKSKFLQIENSKLVIELNKIRSELQSVRQKLYQTQLQSQQLKKIHEKHINDLQKKQSQIKSLSIINSQLEQMNNKKISQIEQNYINKYNQLQKSRDQNISQLMIQKQQELQQRIQIINQMWEKKIEQLEKNFNTKYNIQLSTQARTHQQFQKLQQQNKHLNDRLNQNQKLLATLYPNIKVLKLGGQPTSRKYYDINKYNKSDSYQSIYPNQINPNLKTPTTPNNAKNQNFSTYSNNSNSQSPDANMFLKILKK